MRILFFLPVMAFASWPILTVERFISAVDDSDFVGCEYAYNPEKTPDMPGFNSPLGFKAIDPSLYRPLKPGYHLIHQMGLRTSISSEFGIQTTANCVPEILLMGDNNDPSTAEKIGQVVEGSEIFRSVVRKPITYTGSYQFLAEQISSRKRNVYLALPNTDGCSYVLDHVSTTFYRLKTDPRVFTEKTCLYQSILEAFTEFIQAPTANDKALEFIQSYYQNDILRAVQDACNAVNKHIVIDYRLDAETSTKADFDRWFARRSMLVDVSDLKRLYRNLRFTPWIQVFYDLYYYKVMYQSGGLEANKMKFFMLYVMSFMDDEWNKNGLREGCRTITQRAFEFLTKLMTGRIGTNFGDFVAALQNSLNRKHIEFIHQRFPDAKKHQDSLQNILDRAAEFELSRWLRRDLTTESAVQMFMQFSWYGFAELIGTLQLTTQEKFKDRIAILIDVATFLGSFLNQNVSPATSERMDHAAVQVVTDACTFLPGCFNPREVSVAALHQKFLGHVTPSTLPPVPSVPFARKMFDRLERRMFELEFKKSSFEDPLNATMVEFLFRDRQTKISHKPLLIQFLDIFTGAEVYTLEGKYVIKSIISTCKNACMKRHRSTTEQSRFPNSWSICVQ